MKKQNIMCRLAAMALVAASTGAFAGAMDIAASDTGRFVAAPIVSSVTDTTPGNESDRFSDTGQPFVELTAEQNFFQQDGPASATEAAGGPKTFHAPIPPAVWMFGTAIVGFLGFIRRRVLFGGKQDSKKTQSDETPRLQGDH